MKGRRYKTANYTAIRALDIEEVCNRYGIEVKQGSILCPEHGDRHYGSCRLYHNKYHCFACGASGDAIDLGAHIFMCSRAKAAVRISQDFGIPLVDEKIINPADVFPFTRSQLILLDLAPKTESPQIDVRAFCDIKLPGFYGCPAGDGYVSGDPIHESIYSLWNTPSANGQFDESHNTVYAMVYGKLCEKTKVFCKLYQNKIYKQFGKKQAAVMQDALGYVLEELTTLYFWYRNHPSIEKMAQKWLSEFYTEATDAETNAESFFSEELKMGKNGPAELLKQTKRHKKIKKYSLKGNV